MFLGGAAVRVATVITRLEGGAGQHALRGALIMDPAAYQMTIITGSGDPLLLDAGRRRAGWKSSSSPRCGRPSRPAVTCGPWSGSGNCSAAGPSTSCTRTRPRPGWSGASPRMGRACPGWCTPTTGFPFHEFQAAPRRLAYVRIERWLGQITDLALCVGTGVAVEAVRRRLIAPGRIRTIGVVAARWWPVAGGRDARPLVVAGAARARGRARACPPDATVVGTVGRLTYQKAPEDFLAALQALDRPGVTGVWVGDGELASQVAAQARQMPSIRVLLAGPAAQHPRPAARLRRVRALQPL